MTQESIALFKGIISSKVCLVGFKFKAVVANLLRTAGYDISSITHTSNVPSPPLHMERLRMRTGGLRDGWLSIKELSRPEELDLE